MPRAKAFFPPQVRWGRVREGALLISGRSVDDRRKDPLPNPPPEYRWREKERSFPTSVEFLIHLALRKNRLIRVMRMLIRGFRIVHFTGGDEPLLLRPAGLIRV